ncbi:Smr/MutS family protein [Sphingomonas montanisoli]|uniref:DNA mismatch repair protein MutS n=1 Tax=Sphingomonas montanisoli TaxID=2606412 RepID=A0A5D9CCL7_9SPHN|nr:Smr/MutS family protein [Sphingomonas montanisoli]TZG27845.1 DNA mismatch repair protein MutS [Sphingomonas montanisoli]
MPRRRGPDLEPDEAALWERVTETVRPLRKRALPRPSPVLADPLSPVAVAKPPKGRVPPARVAAIKPVPPRDLTADGLDGGWDRRLLKGLARPDRTLDLHGHTLATAHRAFDAGLREALADGVRVLLLVTGRPPREADDRRGGAARRGAIRGEVDSWIAASPHADRIAAVRGAHPRHGGAGALYLILRRPRG